MKNQQLAEKEEQQRIKNLVLNYDLQQNDDQDGGTASQLLTRNPNIHSTTQATKDQRHTTTIVWKDQTRIGAKGSVSFN